ncbi:MAG: putative lipid II flippase FtsW [Acidimicrobiales bacterium]
MATQAPPLRLVRDGSAPAPRSAPATTRLPGVAALLRIGAGAVDPAEAARRDANLLRLVVWCLAGFGLVMVLASSPVASIAQYGSPWSLFERQTMWTVLGGAAFFVGSRLDVARLRRFVVPLLGGTTMLLVMVLAPGLGKTAGGSSRWIGFGPVSLQPSELTKLVFCLFLADIVTRRESAEDQLRDLVRPVGIVLVAFAVLILAQPDMGTAVVLVCTTFGVLYVAGLHRRLLAAVVGIAATGGTVVALAAPYRRARLLSFLDPFGHASTTGYQVVQSLAALGSGHVTGAGVGSSAAIWGWLPNAQTDFVFAVVGEQLGMAGTVAVLVAFACLGWIGVRIVARTEDRFARLFAAAVTCWIVCQAMINIGGVVGALPETGIPLPFISSGGSSLVVLLAASGLLVNVALHPGRLARPAAKRSAASARAERSTSRAGARSPRSLR